MIKTLSLKITNWRLQPHLPGANELSGGTLITPWASWYVKLRVAHAPGMPGTFSPPPQVSDLYMHHGPAPRTCRDACRDRYLAVSFEVGGGENDGIFGACATRNSGYLVRGPWRRVRENTVYVTQHPHGFIVLCFGVVILPVHNRFTR